MWPFSRRQPDIKSLPQLGDDDQRWGVAEVGSPDSPLIVRYNETARDWNGHSELPIKLGFAIPVNSPNPSGLPDPDENQQFDEIEDIIAREIGSQTPALHALVLTTGEMKEFVFYIPHGVDIKAIHEAIRSAVTTHDVQCLAVIEPGWDSYRQFAPR
jgi:hypothetical protein